MNIKFLAVMFAAAVAQNSFASAASQRLSSPEEIVTIRLLGINDFHGQIIEGKSVQGRPVGGAAVLSAYLRNSEKGLEKNTVITMMGDQVGASVPESGLLDNEPSILFLNTLGNQACSASYRMSPDCNLVATAGNHEFDHGRQQLMTLLYGSEKPPKNNWIALPHYPGASFPYISSNIADRQTGKLIFPPYVIKNVNGVKIAFIGAILKNAASDMLPVNAKELKFLDEAEAINSYVDEVRAKGADIIVAIMHQGGDARTYEGDTRSNVEVHGAINNVVESLDDRVDVVMAGHTHRFINAYLFNKHHHSVLVTEADSYSEAIAEVTLQYDRKQHALLEKRARIITTYADQFPGTLPDAAAENIAKLAQKSVAPVVNAHIGVAQNDISRSANAYGESVLGDLIADAYKSGVGADIAVVNPGSIRTDLKAGEVTWGSLYAIQPFGNQVMKMEFKGKDILDLLEQQWKATSRNILQVSGLTYQYVEGDHAGYHVSDVRVNDQPIKPEQIYTVAVNSFLANGGGDFSVMKRGKVIEYGVTDMEELLNYVKTLPQPFSVSVADRIKRAG